MSDAETMEKLRRHWRVFRNQGIALIVIGVLAILAPFVFALAIAMLLGIALLAAGAAQAVRVYEARGKERILAPAATAALYVIVGILLLFKPGGSVELLTAVIGTLVGVSFLVQGVWLLALSKTLRSPA